jgi:probable rRNA maturation factor
MDPDSRPGPAAQVGSRPEMLPEVLVTDRGWRRAVPGAERVARRAANLARGAAGGAGTVLLASDRTVRALNRRHRGRDQPTNVLSFPGEGGEGGDLALALGTVLREARAARRRPAHHLAHLVVHGALHLQGQDHQRPGEARRMEMEEARLLRRLGVPNPWKSKPGTRAPASRRGEP